MAEPHDTFLVEVECVECGWQWSGWSNEAEQAMTTHAQETSHALSQ